MKKTVRVPKLLNLRKETLKSLSDLKLEGVAGQTVASNNSCYDTCKVF